MSVPPSHLSATAEPTLGVSQLRRAMNLNIAAGSFGIAWYIVCTPQAILNVFVKNQLGATDAQLGLLVAFAQFASVFHLGSILAYSWLPRRKPYWMITSITQRLTGLWMAAAAIYLARGGGKEAVISSFIWASTIGWILTNISASGWWAWMADLIPENIRATFFGRRSAIVIGISMLWFFGATVAIDTLKEFNPAYVYATIFVLGTILGVLDIVLFIWVPERCKTTLQASEQITMQEFWEPVRNPNFLKFCLAVGFFALSVSVAGPFIPPYITAADGLGAPMTWLGIMSVITQLAWIVTAQPWGMLMDRFGRKPAVLLGALYPFTWIGYLFISPHNYIYLLPVMALLAGAIISGWGDGVNQLMLTLTPEKNRTAYVAWYLALTGVISGFGSILGGVLFQQIGDFHWQVTPNLTIGGFHVVILVTMVLCACSFYILTYIKEGKNRSVGYIVARLATPGVFRTFMNLNTLASTADSERVAEALRSIDGGSAALAVTDILVRLDDPDSEVRTEAVRALGRIRSREAVDGLITRLNDDASPIRVEVARALGRIGEPRAVPFLVNALENSTSEEFQEACVQALDNIGGRDSAQRLVQLLHEQRTELVMVSGVEAVSRLGILEAAWENLPRMHQSTNPVLRKQLAMAMGNMLGPPGEFYQYVTGDANQQGIRQARLYEDAAANFVDLIRGMLPSDTAERLVHDLERRLREACTRIECNLCRPAIPELQEILRNLIKGMTGQTREIPDDILLEFAFFRDVKLGLGFWFCNEVANRLDSIKAEDQVRLDALLIVYFIGRYHPPPPEHGQKTSFFLRLMGWQ